LLLLWLGRRLHRPGFLILVFTIWYGTARLITDFLRVDRRYFGLTGSQISASVVGLVCLYLLARYRGAPPRWADPPGSRKRGYETGSPEAEQELLDAESSRHPPGPPPANSGE
jgi:Prolipoprotein diacylglyceryl transferase